MTVIPQCVWWCAKSSNLYNPAHRCFTETDLIKMEGKLLCRHHRAAFLKTGKIAMRPK